MTTPSDNDCDNQYTRAAAQLAQWKEAASWSATTGRR